MGPLSGAVRAVALAHWRRQRRSAAWSGSGSGEARRAEGAWCHSAAAGGGDPLEVASGTATTLRELKKCPSSKRWPPRYHPSSFLSIPKVDQV